MKRSVSLLSAVSIVITNMIGIGILATPGVLTSYLNNTTQVMMVWVFGGLIAFMGAIVYGQMGSLMPHSGGEFHYLSRIYHPIVGTIAGWVSVIAGFSGPIALSAIAFAKYSLNISFVNHFFSDSIAVNYREKIVALLLISFLSLFHVLRKRSAINFQLILTSFLICFLLIISYLGITYKAGAAPENLSSFTGNESNFGIALLLAVYSYTGWNASCYFAGEIKDPKRNLPLSLFLGVLLVMCLYIIVNYSLIGFFGASQLNGEVDFLSEFGSRINGQIGHIIITSTVLVILLASISSMIFTGSCIPLIKSKQNKINGIEHGRRGSAKMHALQVSIAALFILFASFQQLLLILTLILTLFTILTAFGIFLLPWRRLNVSTFQKIAVKFSAAVLLLFLFWLVINSFMNSQIFNYWLSLSAALAFSVLMIFLISRKQNKKVDFRSLIQIQFANIKHKT
jgi:APA family basic amino acid/polyamine antiporter